jgi:hypothetical protein
MITFEEAKQIALNEIGPEWAIREDQILEKLYGWYFSFVRKEYLGIDDVRGRPIGSNGLIVNKEDGHVFVFGSAFSLERDIAAYEAGFRYEKYDLTITSITDIETTASLLYELNMVYVIPELDNGTVWEIPQSYTVQQIKDLLRDLPYTFHDQSFYFHIEVFWRIEAIDCCQYELREHQAKTKGD